ncbi:efflux RND transporter permease subunit [Calditrichota bacterium GD2]
MFLADISIKRPVMVTMGLLVFILFGALAYFGLTLDLMPQVDIPVITVQTVYPGAGPKEIENQVSKKIEDAVGTISKLDFMQSYSMEGVSFVIIRFKLGKDIDIANQEIKDRINSILNQLPRDIQLPVVEKFDVSAFPIMDVLLTGNMPLTELYELADKKVKDRLAQIEGVGKVNVIGGQKREIRIALDNRVVFENAISLPQLSQILAAQNLNLPGGHFIQGSQELSVRVDGEFDRVEALKKLEIPTAFGMQQLGKLATVSDAGAEIRQRSIFFDNKNKIRQDNVVLLSIIKSADGNTVKMAEEIRKELPNIKAELPSAASISIIHDRSNFIKSSVEDTLNNIILGVLFTGLVLLFFLHDLRSTIIVALAMPTSILSTLLLIKLSDFSLNVMTLMGLSTAVGILVTNSVVVLENIFRHKEMGSRRRDAAGKGTAEIAVAVIASTLTNIVVFLPIASMTSIVGQFFKEFALTVTYATIFSLIVSFTITPMLASLLLPEVETKKHRLGQRLEAMFHRWEQWYQSILLWMVKSKKSAFSVVAFTVLLFVVSLFVAARVGFEFFPLTDEGDILIELELPQGYQLEESARLVNTVEERLRKHKEVKHILTTIGMLSDLDVGVNLAKMQVKLVDVSMRELRSDQIANQFIQELADIPNAKIRVAAISSMGGDQAPITFYLMGQDNDRLEVYKRQIMEKIRKIPGLINLNTSSRSGKPEITIKPYRQRLAETGLTVTDLAFTIRAAMEGLVTTRYREAGNEYDIRVTLDDRAVDSPEEIKNLTVVSPRGIYRLAQLATFEVSQGYSKIMHKDKYKAIEFTAYNAPGVPLGEVVAQINQKMAEIDFKPGYKYDWGGDAQMMAETTADMLRTFLIAIALTYMLLAAIMESFTQPLIILGTIPLGLIGVFWALFITGKTMNTISMMAIVMLVGIVVNNAILLLDYTNILRRQGKKVKEALVEACPTKLKPIIMSTVAIMLGMAPLALGIGSSGVEIRQPMGIVSIGGLLVSAGLTLLVIPALYFLTTQSDKDAKSESLKTETEK